MGSVGEECRLLVVQLNSLAVKVYGTGIISRLKGLVALVLEFDSHFAKSAFVWRRSSLHRRRSKGEEGEGFCRLRRAHLQPLKSVAKREEVNFERKDSEISLWNAKEAK